jgi:RNA polymerase sigma-70 factor (ECF subfamily)
MEPLVQTRAEAEMIAAILAGDTQLYHALIRPHERGVYMMALSFMKNEADAEDVAQEAYFKAFRNLSKFRAEAKFSTWLISITLNEARSRLRHSHCRSTLTSSEAASSYLRPELVRRCERCDV